MKQNKGKMDIMRKLILCICAIVLTTSGALASGGSRVITPFDADWRFHLGDADGAASPTYNDRDWRPLRLPHDWSIEGENVEDNPGGGTIFVINMSVYGIIEDAVIVEDE